MRKDREGIRYTLQRPFTPRELAVTALEMRNSYAAYLLVSNGYDENHTKLLSNPDQPLMEDITGLSCVMPVGIHDQLIDPGNEIIVYTETNLDLAPRLFRHVMDNLSSRLRFNEY